VSVWCEEVASVVEWLVFLQLDPMVAGSNLAEEMEIFLVQYISRMLGRSFGAENVYIFLRFIIDI
jgi:hypothetical protein